MSGEGERASRPNSLLLEPPPPEREPLHFDVQLVGAPPEVEQLVNNIKQVAEDFLYHWKTFPIVLPPSQFTGPGNKPSDIIIAPPCDELDAAALDAGVEPQPLSPKQLHAIREKGLHKDNVFKPKKLSTKQLESIHEWGYVALTNIYVWEFEVPSRHFPGQSHVWRVAGWLQRGRARAREELYCHVARAVALLVVVARDRLLRDEPLSVIAGGKALLQGLHRLLDVLIGMPSLEARDLDKKIREERSRYLVAELICKEEDQEDITALAAWVSRAMRRAASEKTDARDALRLAPRVPCVYTTPQRTQVDLRLYRRDIARRAAAPLQALLERESRGWFLHFRERRAAHLASQKVPIKDIEEVHSLLYTSQYLTCFNFDNPYSIHSNRILLTTLSVTLQELRAAKTPTREFTWATRIWLPRNWSVVRHFRGRSERIPTVLSSRATSIVTPRSDPSQPVFLVHRERLRRTATRYPAWRLLNLAHRTWCWGWNMMFLLGVLVPWYSPVRAELEALAQWAADTERLIERPLRDYAHFVDACFGPFSVQIANTGAYKQLEKECNELVMSVREKVSARRRDLALGLTEAARARVRMAAPDLRKAVQACALELSRAWSGRGEEWWSARGLQPADWHALAANTLVEVFDAEVLVALGEGEARLALEGGAAARAWAARCGRGLAPPDVLAERDHWPHQPDHLHTHGVWDEWSGTPAPRVPPPALDVSAFSPRAPLQPPVPHPAAVALVLHNRESDNPVPLDSDLCADILRTLEDAPDTDDRRELEKRDSEVERYRGGGSSASSSASGSASTASPHSPHTPQTPHTPHTPHSTHDTALCSISGSRERAACRWTLTGRGVRLRADLASPEDVTLDADRHVGTSV
ncbi:PREDICTED: uncharacterized protein LOC106106899 [Papilio polytes]|uniref:uncharacterized protein LOC106106899 n=1 Tax=Papilio polytes TaxID=76194 RepID=UPI0006760A8B|nr:PREDICTED: uncharacterized protein LOC106106899 [Papilio polytes]